MYVSLEPVSDGLLIFVLSREFALLVLCHCSPMHLKTLHHLLHSTLFHEVL